MKNGCTLLVSIIALVVVQLACGQPAEEWQLRGWTQTPTPFEPTQTAIVVEITTTPLYTYTPLVKVVTETPSPEYLCVTASEAVYLRPSAGIDNYPITPLPLGAKLSDFGGREENEDGGWAFVGFGVKRGWVSLNFVQSCE